MSESIRRLEKDGVVILYPDGEFVFDRIEPIRDLIFSLMKEQKYRLILNLRNVTYVDSSGIGVFIRYFSSFRNNGGEMVFCEASEGVKNILRLAKIHKFMRVLDSEAEAINSLKSISVKQEKTSREPIPETLDQFDLDIIEVMSLLLEAEATGVPKTNEIIMQLQRLKKYYTLAKSK
jgi:anti-anti-sigma factor